MTVAAELTRRGEMGKMGGAPYLHTLISSVPTAANAGYYAKIVAERAILRRLVEAGTRIVQLAYGAGGEVDDLVDTAQAEVYAVTERRSSEDYLPLSEVMEGALDEIEAINSRGGQLTGVPTGFADLDKKLGGLHPSDLIILAGRPSMGKTALATNIAFNAARAWQPARGPEGRIDLTRPAEDGAVVAFFSLEMSAEQLATRVLAETSGTSSDKIRRGEPVVNPDKIKSLKVAADVE